MSAQCDMSDGRGQCWRTMSAEDIPANIWDEILCEVIENGRRSCDDYTASNGLHYRW